MSNGLAGPQIDKCVSSFKTYLQFNLSSIRGKGLWKEIMSDPIHNWMKELGATNHQLQDVHGRMEFICKHFDIPYMATSKGACKKMFSGVRRAIENGDDVDREKFIVLCLSSVRMDRSKTFDADHMAFARSKNFYGSQRWKNLRYLALERSNKCQACGASPDTGAVLHVDHVLSRTIYPEFALELGNLQILCADCNLGKGNVNMKDFRPK